MKELLENWSDVKSALLTGLPEHKRKMVAPLLENQKQQLLSESESTGSTGTSAIAGFRKIMIPMIRRVIPNAIATEIVGVQPMTGPVGQVYSMRYLYKEAVTPRANDQGVGLLPDGTIGYDPTSANANSTIAQNSEAFGNVNALRRFYSGAAGASSVVGSTGADVLAGAAISGAGASGQGWGSALDAAYTTAAGARGPLYGGGGSWLEGNGGRKMGLEIVSQAVEAKSRKLQASWTIEAMQDMQNQHGLDIENEMTQAMSAEIVQEIDNEIITDLISLAGTAATYDGSVPAAAGFYKPTFVGDRLANLGVQINYVANEIARKTRRAAGNFIVCSPMIVSTLQAASKSVFAPAVEGSFQGPNGTKLVGTLNGNIKVYSYLWNQSQAVEVGGTGGDVILIGYKGGNGETDSGYFYAPYIPLMSSGIVVNPTTFQPVISLMTRYGKATFTDTATSLGNTADYYGKITVTGLSLL
jgi:hypothetical protein